MHAHPHNALVTAERPSQCLAGPASGIRLLNTHLARTGISETKQRRAPRGRPTGGAGRGVSPAALAAALRCAAPASAAALAVHSELTGQLRAAVRPKRTLIVYAGPSLAAAAAAGVFEGRRAAAGSLGGATVHAALPDLLFSREESRPCLPGPAWQAACDPLQAALACMLWHDRLAAGAGTRAQEGHLQRGDAAAGDSRPSPVGRQDLPAGQRRGGWRARVPGRQGRPLRLL